MIGDVIRPPSAYRKRVLRLAGGCGRDPTGDSLMSLIDRVLRKVVFSVKTILPGMIRGKESAGGFPCLGGK
jgi:hypothetical protein